MPRLLWKYRFYFHFLCDMLINHFKNLFVEKNKVNIGDTKVGEINKRR